MIPCIEKDAPTLDRCLSHLRRFLRHPIGQIFVVSPSSAIINEIISRHGAVSVLEQQLLGFSPSDLLPPTSGADRRGRLYQQLIKFAAYQLGNSPWMLLFDADTVLLRPQSYERNGRWLVQYSHTADPNYQATAEAVLPGVVASRRGFVCEQFFLSWATLQQVSVSVFKGPITPQSVAAKVPWDHIGSFSEYEMLGQYCSKYHSENIVYEYYRNAVMNTQEYDSKAWKRWLFPLFFRSASFHIYLH